MEAKDPEEDKSVPFAPRALASPDESTQVQVENRRQRALRSLRRGTRNGGPPILPMPGRVSVLARGGTSYVVDPFPWFIRDVGDRGGVGQENGDGPKEDDCPFDHPSGGMGDMADQKRGDFQRKAGLRGEYVGPCGHLDPRLGEGTGGGPGDHPARRRHFNHHVVCVVAFQACRSAGRKTWIPL
ncbi:hypothetical protein QJS10_CPB04g01358 [Acorus calamus]|uniref:Uncharacterized protein n=1 Tax=Acorus calamus TaxID=4465 RepID=A0AAV9F2J8_ACOCL|nr:hypothetical protein QJS10_CPB04g01358 [Acorus calamus]